MNQKLYDAVFGCGEQKVDPFENADVDFDPIISDMRLCGYEITSLNVAEYLVLQQLDAMSRYKHQIVEFAQDMDNRDDFCREKYGVSFKDIDALDPKNDIEWDLKSGKVIIYIRSDHSALRDAYDKLFGASLDKFYKETGFEFKQL